MARIAVVVSPGTERSRVVGRRGDAWRIRVAAAPERGRANEALLDLLGSVLGVARRDVRIAAGASSRRKIVEVAGIAPAEIERRLNAASEH